MPVFYFYKELLTIKIMIIMILIMNIKEFLEYKKNCPLCGKNLNTFLISKKRKIEDLNDEWCQVIFKLNSLKKSQDYYLASLVWNKYSNSFFVDFLRKNGSLLDNCVPVSLLKSFQNYIKNLGGCSIYRACNNCDKYHYHFNDVKINYSNNTISPLSINFEHFELLQPTEDGYKHFKLNNNYIEGKSELFYTKTNEYYVPRWDMSFRTPRIKTHLIKFSNEEILDKLNKIILFS